MDIISRLNLFVTQTQLTSSNLAEKLNIPKPSLSQILNGRNKKISNEFIEKLHNAFPELNILWLIFGEGNMFVGKNDTIIPQNDPLGERNDAEEVYKKEGGFQDKEYNLFTDVLSEEENQPTLKVTNSEAVKSQPQKIKTEPKLPKTTQQEHDIKDSIRVSTTKIGISTIIVYYDDLSYQIFKPGDLSSL